ncbi:hypothetical protein GE061_003974 [Apolygus lucorum]|uniref:E3 ubiquitin-protein ligase Topors n=1 Tax=Apolygus lucorum TaxID=248454 RepID=A0A8S9WXW4_APOLU|nr:hypothetical protein GE061_003974 [Apolygus lucorum]
MDRNPTTRKRCASPDVSCPICLAEITNKAVTDSCSHSFCFACLSEWSKVKPECPLCKLKFSVIKHTFKSEGDYKEHRVDEPLDVTSAAHIVIDVAVQRAMGFMTTMGMATSGRAPVLFYVPQERVSQLRRASQIPTLPHSTSSPVIRFETNRSSVDFRRSVYQRNLWVRPVKRGRMRQSSPEFYRANPTHLDRLIPWLTRELSVTTSSYYVEYACLDIVSWIKEHHIRSYAFKRFVQIYFGANTDHFVHEFYNFARSPLDLQAYDNHSQYSDMETPTNEAVRSNVEFRRSDCPPVPRRPLATLIPVPRQPPVTPTPVSLTPRRLNIANDSSEEETDDSDSGVNDSDDSDLIEINPATTPSNLIADASNPLQSASSSITPGPSSSPSDTLTNHKRSAFFRPRYPDSSSSDEDFVPLKKSKLSE